MSEGSNTTGRGNYVISWSEKGGGNHNCFSGGVFSWQIALATACCLV